MQMFLKTVPPTTFLCSTHELRVPEITTAAAVAVPGVIQAMRDSEMQATGVMQFLYDGCDGDPEKVFTLDIAIPVDEKKDVAAPYVVREVPEFRCAAIEYRGGMSRIGEGYMELAKQMREAGLEPNDLAREVYTYFMDAESPENITELQMGIR